MTNKELKKAIDVVSGIDVKSETEAIFKEELLSYVEDLQKEHNVLTEFKCWLKSKEMLIYNSSDGEMLIRYYETLNKLIELEREHK